MKEQRQDQEERKKVKTKKISGKIRTKRLNKKNEKEIEG